ATGGLDRLGLRDEVAQRGSLHGEIPHYAPAGNRVQVITPHALAGPGKPSCGGIMRTDLHEILLESALEAGAHIRMGTTVASLNRGDEAVAGELSGGDTRQDEPLPRAPRLPSRHPDPGAPPPARP